MFISDNDVVDEFAQEMKNKLLMSRKKGRQGWQQCNKDELISMLLHHIEKGDPVDVANFCMFLWHLNMSTKQDDIKEK